MLVCHCRGISDRQIKRAVRNGACSVRQVARETGAGMRCGGCRATVTQLVEEALAEGAPAPSTSMSFELPVLAEI